jgi:CTP-dependent riboflavin kinase
MAWLRDLSINKDHRVYRGIVRTGRGGAVGEMNQPDFTEGFKELTGLNVIPGTLNIKIVEPLNLNLLRYLKFADIGWEFDPTTQGIDYKGEIGVYYRRATIKGKYKACVLVFTWVSDIHTDAELVSPHHLRTVLKLKDGDKVKFTLDKE